ncbi:MAG TPA: hypothetical protein DCE43_08190, partial [Planctomycetaceae bacterium]|nr:hypothetical protein [Planctomycetaceae bacterium]
MTIDPFGSLAASHPRARFDKMTRRNNHPGSRFSMKLVIHPPVDDVRLERICEAAGEMAVVNAVNPEEAAAEIIDATAFFGKITPELLSVAGQLEWVQAPTASLEHYVFDELVAHPCTLTNMRGLYYDVIADHV